MIAGRLLAVGCAVAGSVGVQLKQRGAVAAPTSRAIPCAAQSTCLAPVVDGRPAVRAGCVAVARRCAVAGVASIVQAVISAGLVFLAMLAERFFGFQLGRRQWTGLLVTAVGLAVLALTQAPTTHNHASAAALIAVESAVIAISSVLIGASIRLEHLNPRKGILGPRAGSIRAGGHLPPHVRVSGRLSDRVRAGRGLHRRRRRSVEISAHNSRRDPQCVPERHVGQVHPGDRRAIRAQDAGVHFKPRRRG
jgi:hypothetical protein